MSNHHKEVHVVMAGLIALTKKKINDNGVLISDLGIFVRDSGHDLQGRVYGFDQQDSPVETRLPLANHRVCFDFDRRKPSEAKKYARKLRGSAPLPDPPRDEDEAEYLRVPSIELATDRKFQVKIDPRCVDGKPKGNYRRIVGAQVHLDDGILCSGHLLSRGDLVPQLYFRGRGKGQESYVTCADVMILKMVAPADATVLQISLTLLCKKPLTVLREINLSAKGPVIVSLTNQSRPVSEIPPVAAHFRMYRSLLQKTGGVRPRVYIPRLRGGKKSSFSLAQPGFDFDNVLGVTPPSVQNRPMCPFADIPD